MSDVVTVQQDGTVAIITIDRPKALNAINAAVLDGLAAALDQLEGAGDVRCAVLTGAGGKAFVAGADIAAMRDLAPVEAEQFAARGQRILDRIAALPFPVIAAVGGFALGGGCELAMACDLVIAGERAKFGQPEVNLGVIPGFGGTQRLVRRVGLSAALDLCLTGRIVKADEALRMGLCSQVVEGDVVEAAAGIAKTIASKGPVAIRLCKRAIHENADSALGSAQAAERTLFGLCFATSDQSEGMAAFLEKRQAQFTGQQANRSICMFDLSEDHLAIRDMARDFARSEILPGAQARDKAHVFPTELVGKLAELGLLGVFIPEQYGGSGLDILSYVVALEEICYADAGVGVIMSVQNSLASWPILAFGTEAQKQKYLPSMATGEKIGCYALTEPEAGSDAGSQRTRAEIVDGGYRLNGTKLWITNGPQADVAVTYANLDPDAKHKGVCAFILEKGWEGFSVGKVEDKMGIRCSDTSELVYDNLFVPAENRLHDEREGFKVAMATLDGGRIGIAAQALGIAQRCLDLAVGYARERVTFGKPIARHQAIQWKIADMKTRVDAARLLTWRAAALKDAGKRASLECSMAKLHASETANFCAYEAVQIFGGLGYSQEYEVERLYRDARITTIYEGTSEIQRLVIAKSVLG